jgi:hypothetical protein
MIDDGECGEIGGMISRENRSYSEKNLPHCYFAHHKSDNT